MPSLSPNELRQDQQAPAILPRVSTDEERETLTPWSSNSPHRTRTVFPWANLGNTASMPARGHLYTRSQMLPSNVNRREIQDNIDLTKPASLSSMSTSAKPMDRKSIQKAAGRSHWQNIFEQPTIRTNVIFEAMAERSRIRSIDWNPLGTLIATGSHNKVVRVWNPDRPNIRYSTELKGHEGAVEQVRFNPIKDAELCVVSADGAVKFWDVRNKALLNEVKGLGELFTLVWHPEGECVIVGNKADTIFVIDPTKSEPIATHQRNIQTNQITFCWSGKKIFLTTGEGRVEILNFPEFTPRYGPRPGDANPYSLNGHTSAALSLALSPTGRYLASGGSDSIIALWDTKTWICARTLTDMVGPVRSISFSFDGSFILGGSDDGTNLEIAHVESGEYIFSQKTKDICPMVAWHPSKYHLAFSEGTRGGLNIIQVDTEARVPR